MLKGIKELNIKQGKSENSTVEIKLESNYTGSVQKINGEIFVNIEKKQPVQEEKPDKKILSGKKIVIDPGHGGTSIGAVGPRGTREKDIALDTSLIIEKKLREQGANVILTRRTDVNVSLAQRVNIANKERADLFISVHYNGFSNPAANGTETYWYTRGSQTSSRLANIIQKQMVEKLKRRNRGVKQANFYVLRETRMPAVLIEPLFITNPTEEDIILNPVNREKISDAVVEGIIKLYS